MWDTVETVKKKGTPPARRGSLFSHRTRQLLLNSQYRNWFSIG